MSPSLAVTSANGSVPLLDCRSETAIGAGKLYNGAHSLGGHHGGRLDAFGREFPADRAGPIECMQRGVEHPARAIIQ